MSYVPEPPVPHPGPPSTGDPQPPSTLPGDPGIRSRRRSRRIPARRRRSPPRDARAAPHLTRSRCLPAALTGHYPQDHPNGESSCASSPPCRRCRSHLGSEDRQAEEACSRRARSTTCAVASSTSPAARPRISASAPTTSPSAFARSRTSHRKHHGNPGGGEGEGREGGRGEERRGRRGRRRGREGWGMEGGREGLKDGSRERGRYRAAERRAGGTRRPRSPEGQIRGLFDELVTEAPTRFDSHDGRDEAETLRRARSARQRLHGRARRPALRHRRPAGHHAAGARGGVRVPRRPTASAIRDARRACARITRARDPAGLDRRLDLPEPERPPAGHRPRRARPQAVPLPRRRGARRATRRSSTGWSPSARPCRGCASASSATWRCRGLPREKVLAAVVRLLDATLIRVGNEEYARDNGPSALTTLRDATRSVRRRPAAVRVPGQVRQRRTRAGRRPRAWPASSGAARTCPAQELFHYLDDARRGARRRARTTSTTTCARSRGEDFTAKDFRTWGATVLAAGLLGEIGPARPRPRRRACRTSPSAWSRTTSATRRPCAARPISTRPCWTRSAPAGSSRRASRRPRRSTACARPRHTCSSCSAWPSGASRRAGRAAPARRSAPRCGGRRGRRPRPRWSVPG